MARSVTQHFCAVRCGTNRCFGKNIAESFAEPRMETFSVHICNCPVEDTWRCIRLERDSFPVSVSIKEMWF